MYSKRWIKYFFIFSLCIIGLIGLFNYIIDPYGLNQFVSLEKVNSKKISNTKITTRFKLNRIEAGEFDTLMLGTSRTGVIDPELVNKYLNANTFSLTYPGSVTEIHYNYLQYALEYNHVKNVIYGIDFMSFNEAKTVKKDFIDYYDLKGEVENKDKIYNYDLYFSLDTFMKSVKVFYENFLGIKYTEKKYLYSSGMRDYIDNIEQLQKNNFDIDKEIEKHIRDYFEGNSAVYKDYKLSKEYLLYFRKIVELCNSKNIKLWVYIPPIYSQHYDRIMNSKYRKDFLLYKKHLAKIVDFIDFSGHNIITKNKHNYWDSSHLRKEKSYFVIDRLFNNDINFNYGINIEKEE
jgi:hypothetical protein